MSQDRHVKLQPGSTLDRHKEFIAVNGLWITRGAEIIAESQIGSCRITRQHRKFVQEFMDQIILPARPSRQDESASPSLTIYVKKRQCLFHVLYDDDLIFLSSTRNTLKQSPIDVVFDLLYAIKAAFLLEDDCAFSDVLGDLHTEYQLRARPRISLNFDDNPLFATDALSLGVDFANEEALSLCDSDDDANLSFCDGYQIGSNDSSDTAAASPRYGSGSDDSGADCDGTRLSPSPTATATRFSTDYHNIFCAGPSFTQSPSQSPRHLSQNVSHLSLANRNSSSSSSTSRVLAEEVHELKEVKEVKEASKEAVSHFRDVSESHSEDTDGGLQILKRGWLTKLGSTFKTWRYRYFELWSNGLLNYFDNELKGKQKGSLNVADEVMGCDLYQRTVKGQQAQHGLVLTTHERSWHFVAKKRSVRDEWYLLLQTMAFSQLDWRATLHSLSTRVEALTRRWEHKLKNISFDVDDPRGDECNVYRLQFDVKAAVNLCLKCQRDVTYLRGSDLHSHYARRIDHLRDNMMGALSTIEAIIHSRNERVPRRLSARTRGRGRGSTKGKGKHSRITSCLLGMDENRVVLTGNVRLRLPSKAKLCKKAALSKKTRECRVVVQQKFFQAEMGHTESAPPLLWRFDDVASIGDVKGVYYGRKKTGKIEVDDIEQYELTMVHASGRRLQFVFGEQNEAFLWFSTLRSLLDDCNRAQSPKTPVKPQPRSAMARRMENMQIPL